MHVQFWRNQKIVCLFRDNRIFSLVSRIQNPVYCFLSEEYNGSKHVVGGLAHLQGLEFFFAIKAVV